MTVDAIFIDGLDQPAPTVYRTGALALRDPHVFYQLIPTICSDITDVPSIGLNPQIAAAFNGDSDGDGFLDASPMLVFRPFNTSGAAAALEGVAGDCTVAQPTSCTPTAGAQVSRRYYQFFNLGAGDVCLGKLAGTTTNWGSGAQVPEPSGICYSSTAQDLSLPIGGANIPLLATRYGAPQPMSGAMTGGGLMRGFLRESDANTIMIQIDANTSVPLAQLLPDGTLSCKTGVAGGKDLFGGVSGWWFYFEYRQDSVSTTGF